MSDSDLVITPKNHVAQMSALELLRAFISRNNLPENNRLPPERELSEILGVSRSELRRALAILEEEDVLWRHVGKGTFIGAKPAESHFSLVAISSQTRPADIVRARLLVEPEFAREAALNATLENIQFMRDCVAESRDADTWRQYEIIDNRLHRAIVEATNNPLLIAIFDTITSVQRAVAWGRLRTDPSGPPSDHHGFNDHDEIVSAIAERDMVAAAVGMRNHLSRVLRQYLAHEAGSELDLRN